MRKIVTLFLLFSLIVPQIIHAEETKTYPLTEDSTFMTFPEWYIVYSADEYADFTKDHDPVDFPYQEAIDQYWNSVSDLKKLVATRYPGANGSDLMLNVIGGSFSIEYKFRNLYEHTVGAYHRWLTGGVRVPEDDYAQRVYSEYADFLNDTPWYAFPYFQKLIGLWRDTPLLSNNIIRSYERKGLYSLEYLTKGIYGKLIGAATNAMYSPAAMEVPTTTSRIDPELREKLNIKLVKEDSETNDVLLPRYRGFTAVVPQLARENVQFFTIAGQKNIMLTTLITPEQFSRVPALKVVLNLPVLTQPPLRRVAIETAITDLTLTINSLHAVGATIEHIYDY